MRSHKGLAGVALATALLLVASLFPALPGMTAPAMAAATAAVSLNPEPAQPRVRGATLIDARTGKQWIPRGANWPDMEYSCVQGWEAAKDHSLSETRAMASWGFNVVRLPLNQDCWLGVDGANNRSTTAKYRAEVLRRVRLAQQVGLVVIIDLHWSAPAGRLATNGQRAMPDNQSEAFWRSVAATFKSNRSVMFDLFNEPFSPAAIGGNKPGVTSTSWSCWRDGGCAVTNLSELEGDRLHAGTSTYRAVGMAALVRAVRGTGARQPLILSGLEYANDLTQWADYAPKDPLNQLIAGWHNYSHQSCKRGCWSSMVAKVTQVAPVVMTETGYDRDHRDTTWLADAMAFGVSSGVGYMPWAWWRLNVSDHAQKNHEAVLAPHSFTPSAPVGTALKAALTRDLAGRKPKVPIALTKPVITGRPKVGKKLTAKVGAWAAATTEQYRWYRNGRVVKGATSATYKLKKADWGKKLTVQVTVTKRDFKAVTVTSKPLNFKKNLR